MAAVVAVSRFGPDSYTVSPAGFVDGGMMVEPDPANAGFIRVASAASNTFLGVAIQPAEGSAFANPITAGYNAPILDISVPVERVAVGWQGTYKLLYSEAVNFGQLVSCGANGTVVPYQLAAWTVVNPTDGVTTGAHAGVADGVTTAGSTTVTSATAAFIASDVGRAISGGSIPANTTITAVGSGTSITISAAATVSAVGVALVFGAQFRVSSAASTFTQGVEGATISGGSIPAATIVTTFVDSHTLILSNAPTVTAAGVTFTFTNVPANQTQAGQVVGRCVEPSGVIAGALGKTRLAGV